MAMSDPQSQVVSVPDATPVPPRQAHWRALIEAWRGSGLSQSAFCRREGVARRSFSAWKARMAREARGRPRVAGAGPGRRPRGPAFVPVRIVARRLRRGAPPPSASAAWASEIEIALAGGPLVRVRGRVDPSGLRHVLAALDAGRC